MASRRISSVKKSRQKTSNAAKIKQEMNIIKEALCTLDNWIFNRTTGYDFINNAYSVHLTQARCNEPHFWEHYISSMVEHIGQTEATFLSQRRGHIIHSDIYNNIACWIYFVFKSFLVDDHYRFSLPTPQAFHAYVYRFLDSRNEYVQINLAMLFAIFGDLYSKEEELQYLFDDTVSDFITTICKQEVLNLRALVYCLEFMYFAIVHDVIFKPSFWESIRRPLSQLTSIHKFDHQKPDPKVIEHGQDSRKVQVAILARYITDAFNGPLTGQMMLVTTDINVHFSYGYWCCGIDRNWLTYQPAVITEDGLSVNKPIRELLNRYDNPQLKLFFFECILLTQGSIKVGISPHGVVRKHGSSAPIRSDLHRSDGGIFFDAFERGFWVSNQEKIRNEATVVELPDATVIGCLLQPTKTSACDIIHFYVNGQLEMMPHNEEKLCSILEKDYYISICPSAFQQAVLVLERDCWRYPPPHMDLYSLPSKDYRTTNNNNSNNQQTRSS